MLKDKIGISLKSLILIITTIVIIVVTFLLIKRGNENKTNISNSNVNNNIENVAGTEQENNKQNSNNIQVHMSKDIELIDDFNILDIQGKIDEYRSCYTFNALFVGNKMYEYDSADSGENDAAYVCWDIGNYKSIVSYNENVCVVENADHTLTAIIATSKNKETHECITKKMELPAKPNEYVYCEADAGEDWISLIYTKDGIPSYLIKTIDGTVMSEGALVELMDEDDATFGLSKFVISEDGNVWGLNDNNEIRTFELRVTYIEDDDKYYFDCFVNDEDYGELKNAVKWLLIGPTNFIVANDGDNDNLHFYVENGSFMNPNTDYVETVGLPDGKKAKDIVNTSSTFNYILVEFSGNEFYKLYYNNVFGSNPYLEEKPVWYKLQGLGNVAIQKNSKQIMMYGPMISILTNDGYFYSLTNDDMPSEE